MRNLDAHFSCQDASLVLQFFYELHMYMYVVSIDSLVCYYTEHIRSGQVQAILRR